VIFLKKFSFQIGLIGAVIGIMSNIIVIVSGDISGLLRKFAIAAIVFSIIALLGVLFINKIKSLGLMMMFLGVISNIPVSITSGSNNIIVSCILSAVSIIMLLVAGIGQVENK
jgi:hypothetical protein